ncbi:unnamed protein product, partial [Prorocentrum cordatum]
QRREAVGGARRRQRPHRRGALRPGVRRVRHGDLGDGQHPQLRVRAGDAHGGAELQAASRGVHQVELAGPLPVRAHPHARRHRRVPRQGVPQGPGGAARLPEDRGHRLGQRLREGVGHRGHAGVTHAGGPRGPGHVGPVHERRQEIGDGIHGQDRQNLGPAERKVLADPGGPQGPRLLRLAVSRHGGRGAGSDRVAGSNRNAVAHGGRHGHLLLDAERAREAGARRGVLPPRQARCHGLRRPHRSALGDPERRLHAGPARPHGCRVLCSLLPRREVRGDGVGRQDRETLGGGHRRLHQNAQRAHQLGAPRRLRRGRDAHGHRVRRQHRAGLALQRRAVPAHADRPHGLDARRGVLRGRRPDCHVREGRHHAHLVRHQRVLPPKAVGETSLACIRTHICAQSFCGGPGSHGGSAPRDYPGHFNRPRRAVFGGPLSRLHLQLRACACLLRGRAPAGVRAGDGLGVARALGLLLLDRPRRGRRGLGGAAGTALAGACPRSGAGTGSGPSRARGPLA